MTITAVVQVKTGRFMANGHDLDDDYIRVVVPYNPDPLREKWDGKIVAKTDEEVKHALSVRHRAAALAALDATPAARAVLIRGLVVRLGHPPTPEEIEKEIDGYIEVFQP